jgi:RsiW-degrading membrane proteinase PrsW (M82 family)
MDWKRIGKIIFWLFTFPPVGLWMLWKDRTLPRSVKQRILIYGFFGMIALSLLWICVEFHSVEKALNSAGG